jgi:rhamnulokinase
MTPGHTYLAIDLGAESGRAILASLSGDRLEMQAVHRFSNTPVRLPDGLHWDVLALWTEIPAGYRRGGQRGYPAGKASAWIPGWVDFALLMAMAPC